MTGLERHPPLLLEKPKPGRERYPKGRLAAKRGAIRKRKKMFSGE